MSYNIDHVECLVLDARMRAVDIVDLYNDFEGDLAEGNFLEEHLAKAEKLAGQGLDDELVELKNLWWYGEFSGRSYKDTFIKHIAPKIQGHVEAVVTWEGGDSHSGFAIDDGVVTECGVTFALVRPKAKRKAKVSAA